MNRYAPRPYAESIARLALGVEPHDLVRNSRGLFGLRVTVDEHPEPLDLWRPWAPGEQLDDVLPSLGRHGTGRFARVLDSATRTVQRIRVIDLRRRYVPRRFAVTVADEAAVIAAEDDPLVPDLGPAARIFRPSLHPGAAYEVAGLVVRGRVTHAGLPLRWARVQAVVTGTTDVTGWGHADDRGEYVLFVESPPGQIGFAPDPLSLTLTAGFRNPAPAAPPTDPLRVLVDPLWDLIEEPVTLPITTDPGRRVADGRQFPAGYTTHAFPSVEFAQGRTHVADLDLP